MPDSIGATAAIVLTVAAVALNSLTMGPAVILLDFPPGIVLGVLLVRSEHQTSHEIRRGSQHDE